MIKKLKWMLVVALSVSCFSVMAKSVDYSQYTIRAGINTLLNQFNKAHGGNLSIGLMVQSMKNHQTLYARRSTFLFTPASVQKLFTAAAALSYLKPSYRFTTQVLTTGSVVGGVLKGNVYIKFTGDPELKAKDVSQLLSKLKNQGIRTIDGRVYIDNTDYNHVPYPPGWIWDDLSYSFAAPLDTIIINRNKFTLHFYPAKTLGAHPILKADLPMGVAHFANHMITTSTYRKKCPLVIYSDDLNNYTLGGCLTQRYKKQRRTLAIRDVLKFTKALVKQQLQKNGIAYGRRVAVKKAPREASVIAVHYSPVLKKILKEMLKDSDNLTTNSLFKKLGETYFRSAGTWQNSLRALEKILAPLTGVNFKQNLMADGAGLSRYNLVSPKQLSQLLYYIFHSSIVSGPLIHSLPIAGKDGTLAWRLLEFGRGARIRAKTGSMTGVTSLAGFVRSKHNGNVSFVIMINGFVKPRKPYIKLENDICALLVSAQGSQHG